MKKQLLYLLGGLFFLASCSKKGDPTPEPEPEPTPQPTPEPTLAEIQEQQLAQAEAIANIFELLFLIVTAFVARLILSIKYLLD